MTKRKLRSWDFQSDDDGDLDVNLDIEPRPNLPEQLQQLQRSNSNCNACPQPQPPKRRQQSKSKPRAKAIKAKRPKQQQQSNSNSKSPEPIPKPLKRHNRIRKQQQSKSKPQESQPGQELEPEPRAPKRQSKVNVKPHPPAPVETDSESEPQLQLPIPKPKRRNPKPKTGEPELQPQPQQSETEDSEPQPQAPKRKKQQQQQQCKVEHELPKPKLRKLKQQLQLAVAAVAAQFEDSESDPEPGTSSSRLVPLQPKRRKQQEQAKTKVKELEEFEGEAGTLTSKSLPLQPKRRKQQQQQDEEGKEPEAGTSKLQTPLRRKQRQKAKLLQPQPPKRQKQLVQQQPQPQEPPNPQPQPRQYPNTNPNPLNLTKDQLRIQQIQLDHAKFLSFRHTPKPPCRFRKVIAKRQLLPREGRNNPFNNYFVLKNLFDLSSKCPFKFSTRELLSLRSVNTKTYEIGKPYVNSRIGTIEFDFLPAPPGESKMLRWPSSHPYDIFIKKFQELPPSPPFTVENLIVDWNFICPFITKFYGPLDPPHKETLQKYGQLIKKFGSKIQTLAFNNYTTFTNLLGNAKLAKFAALSQLRVIEIEQSWETRGHQFEKLASFLPNPGSVQVVQLKHTIHNFNSQLDYHEYWVGLPEKLFTVFKGLKNLYFTGKVQIGPVNGVQFLARDPRIQFYKKGGTICDHCYSYKENLEFKFSEFNYSLPEHRNIFSTLATDVSNLATSILIMGNSMDVLDFKPYLTKQKWERLKECRFMIEKSDYKYDFVHAKELVLKKTCHCSAW